ncbi:class I SAM-dependent methyltransferase [bacterium]|nr:class I SAM-dependent methyltransferase [bacterium]
MTDPAACIVCASTRVTPFARVDGYDYFRCARCVATFLDPARRLSIEAERERYRRHRNDPADAGYRRHMARLADPLCARLSPGSAGLDYGCGPGPALAQMLREAGHEVRVFDPYFVPDADALAATYDFVTCTETIEHFHRPAEEFARLDRLLRPGGLLAVMTCFQTDDANFADWTYRRDPTHVVFYREVTLGRVAERFGWVCEFPAKDVAIMRKQEIEKRK